MVIPVQITFRNMGHSEAVASLIQKKAEKLQRFYPHIMSCRVIVEQSHHRPMRGNTYHVRVDVTVPGGEIVAEREPEPHHFHEDIQVAARDAFDAVRRQLEDHARRRRADVKLHEPPPPRGRVVKLFSDEGYGFIETPDGREIYFHKNSVRNARFNHLQIGAEVKFDEEEGAQGPQASAVTVVSKD